MHPLTALAYKCTTAFEEGPSLYWQNRQVEMVPSAIPGQDVTATQLKEALMWGVAQWTSNDILSSSDEQCSDFEMKVGESETTDLRAGYDWHHPEDNRNLVVFRRGATHLDSDTWFFARSAIAMTTVTFVRSTGEILDADIELNDQDFLFKNISSIKIIISK